MTAYILKIGRKLKIHRWIGILVFLIIAVKVDWRPIIEIVRKENHFLLLSLISINIITIGLKTLRWRIILADHDIEIGYFKSFLYYASSIFFGFATPGRLGEFSRVFFLKGAGVENIAGGTASVIFDRVYDLFFLCCLSMMAMIFLKPFHRAIDTGIIGLVLLMLAVIATFVLFNRQRSFFKISGNPYWEKIPVGIRSNISNYLSGFCKGKKSHILLNALLTTAGYGILFLQCFFIARELSITISYTSISLAMSFALLFSLLPISIMGIGTREVALLFVLTPLGISSAEIVTLSINFFVVCNIGSVIIGAISWNRQNALKKNSIRISEYK